MTPNFTPMIGDSINLINDEKAGKVFYHHKKVQADSIKDYDLKVQIEGITPYILTVSPQATKEFIENQPQRIDKLYSKFGYLKIFDGSLAGNPTTEKTMLRRKTFSSMLGLKSASKYIPTILDCCDLTLESLKPGKVNFIHKMVDL